MFRLAPALAAFVAVLFPTPLLQPVNASTELAEGLYTTSYDLTNLATLSKHVWHMEMAMDVYDSLLFYSEGMDDTSKTLQSLSTDAPEKMAGEFHYTLYSKANNNATYADNIIWSLYKKDEDDSTDIMSKVLARAALTQGVWMHVTHRLHKVSSECAERLKDASVGDYNGGSHAIDEAAALYIGIEQMVGDYTKGHSLYNLAERGRFQFHTETEGQATVNARVVTLLRETQDMIKTGACDATDGGGDAPLQIKSKSDQIISQMAVPLVQMLIHNMYQHDKNDEYHRYAPLVEVYARAVLPQLAACRPLLSKNLEHNLLFPEDHNKFMSDGLEKLLEQLQGAYHCLGITCADVGSYKDEVIPECVDPSTEMLVGYEPVSDVTEHSYIDIDILQMRILMDEGAFDAAKHIYMHGRNSRWKNTNEFRSLQDLSSSGEIKKSGLFPAFKEYFGDEDYAVTVAMEGLDGADDGLTNRQRRTVVVNSSVFLTLFMYIVGILHDVRDDCFSENKSVRNMAHMWDKAVAYFAGSLEGPRIWGSPDGQLQHRASARLCRTFGRCIEGSDDSGSVLNARIVTAFTEGQTLIKEGNCAKVASVVDGTLVPALLAQLVQGLLSGVYNMSVVAGVYEQDAMKEALIFALSILPLLNDEAADLVERYVVGIPAESGSGVEAPMKDGVLVIFNALQRAVTINSDDYLNKIDCEDVGTLVVEQEYLVVEQGNDLLLRLSICGGLDDDVNDVSVGFNAKQSSGSARRKPHFAAITLSLMGSYLLLISSLLINY